MAGFGTNLLNVAKGIGEWALGSAPGQEGWARTQGVRQRQQEINLQQQHQAILEQEELDRKRQADVDFYDRIAPFTRPAMNGVVREDIPGSPATQFPGTGGARPSSFQTNLAGYGGAPDVSATQTVPGSNAPLWFGATLPQTIYRKADPSRYHKFKDADGQTVEVEFMKPEEIAQRKVDLGAPERAAQVAQTQATSQATAAGTGAGTTQARIDDREKRGQALSQDDVDRYQMPASMVGFKILPEEVDQLSRGIVPATIRADSANFRTKYTADLRAQTQKLIADQRSAYNEERLGYEDRWNAVRAQIAREGESGRNARSAQRIGIDQKLHGSYIDNAFNEEQRQLQAAALLDEHQEQGWFGSTDNVQATKDGEEFTDPWSGKKMTMNYAQRLRLQNALQTSRQRSQNLRERAQDIADRYGLGGTPAANPAAAGGAQPNTSPNSPASGGPAPGANPNPSAPGAPPARSSAAPGAAPAGTSTPQTASAGAPRPATPTTPAPKARTATRAQVQAYAKKFNMTEAAALQAFQKDGITVSE